MHKTLLLLSGLVAGGGVHAADTAVELVTQSFPLERVRLLDGPFKKAMEKNQEVLLKFDVDRMLWPYHEHAGMPTQGERYGGWARKDCIGQISGHYLSALQRPPRAMTHSLRPTWPRPRYCGWSASVPVAGRSFPDGRICDVQQQHGATGSRKCAVMFGLVPLSWCPSSN